MPPSEISVRKQEIDWELQAAGWRVVSYARWSKGDREVAGAEGRSGHPRTAAGGMVGWREIGALGVIGERQAGRVAVSVCWCSVHTLTNLPRT